MTLPQLTPEDLQDPVSRAWYAQILHRREQRKAERLVQELRRCQGCGTSEAVCLAACRMGKSPGWIWKALRELKRRP
jgi:heterodisulfide reductase subunit C